MKLLKHCHGAHIQMLMLAAILAIFVMGRGAAKLEEHIIVNTDPGTCTVQKTNVELGTPDVYDNCHVREVTNDAPEVFPLGDTIVTWMATDYAGNVGTKQQIVTVRDVELPTITCPPDIQVESDYGKCYASGVSLGTPVTRDNCGIAGVTNDAPEKFYGGDTIVTWTVTDNSGNKATCTQKVTVNLRPLITVANAAITANEGTTATNTGSWLGVEPPVTLEANVGDIVLNQNRTWNWSFNCLDGPAQSQTVTITGSGGAGCVSSATFQLTVNNVAPSPRITAPSVGALYQVGQTVNYAGAFTDPGTLDTHTAQWTFTSAGTTVGPKPGTVTEANGSGTTTVSNVFTIPGVYVTTLNVTDKDGASASTSTMEDLLAFVVVYDPTGGFVTGGGWINSPAGAYRLNTSLAGKATFGFTSKYQKGAKVPTGQTEFQFRAADLNFHSSNYEWLVVAGARAQYKGTGTINNAGNYGFILTAIDGQRTGGGGADRFRIKIWDRVSGNIVYDNQYGTDDNAPLADSTIIGGGSIVIHDNK